MSKLPPFGTKLLETFKNSDFYPANDIYLFVGLNAWKKASNFQISRPGTLCLPPWLPPRDYYWPVLNCNVLVFDTGYAEELYIEELVYCLYQNGSNIVRFICPEYKLTVYHKE